LLAAMEELGMIEAVRTPADVLIAYFDSERLHDYLRLSRQLRAAGIGCEVYPEARKLNAQLKYADKRGFRIALVAGQNEFAENRVQVKDLANRTARDASLANGAAEVIATIQEMLA